jgi:hypothetical protein
MPDEDSWRDLPRGGFSSHCQTYPYQQSILPTHDTIQNRKVSNSFPSVNAWYWVHRNIFVFINFNSNGARVGPTSQPPFVKRVRTRKNITTSISDPVDRELHFRMSMLKRISGKERGDRQNNCLILEWIEHK